MRTPILTMLMAILAPAGVWAQVGNFGGSASTAGIPFGSGQTPSLSYAAQGSSSNMFLASLSSQAMYDSNAIASSGAPRGDVIYSLGPQFVLVQATGNFTAALDYQPYFQFYQHLTAYNRVNQSLAADLSYKIGPRLTFRFRESFMDQTGTYQPQPGTDFVPGLGAPTTLNTTVYPPLLSARYNNTRLDATYQMSTRTSLTVFGAYDRAYYNNSEVTSAPVSDTQSVISGAQYAYRLTEHFTLATLYLFQPMRFLGNLPAGSISSTTVQSALISIGWRASQTLSVSLFGGPQYQELRRTQGTSPVQVGSPTSTGTPENDWSWAAGGTVSKQSERTALELSASRSISNGGAWLSAVMASVASLGLHRNLWRRWDGSCGLTYAQNQYLGSTSTPGKVNSETLSLSLGHSLSEKATIRLSYNFIQQQGTSLPTEGANFGHNQVSLGVYYTLRKVPLGR